MERLTLAVGQRIKQSAAPRTRLNVTDNSTTGVAERWADRERLGYVGRDENSLRDSCGRYIESVRNVAALGCVRASSRRAEAKRGAEDVSQQKVVLAMGCAGSDATARGRIEIRNSRTTWIGSLWNCARGSS